MTENNRVCRCFLFQVGKEDILSDIKQHISKIDPSEKANDDLYNSRLKLCSECDFLADGTCLKCGCYPEFRAAFKKKSCPLKHW